MSSIKANSGKGLGEVEQSVMDYVWASGPCSAETCREALWTSRPMKESTVRTILRRLEGKGFVTHDIEGRTYVYRALEARRNVAVRAVKNIIDRFCSGSAEDLVIGMVDNAVISRDEFERIARRIADEKRKERPKEKDGEHAGRKNG